MKMILRKFLTCLKILRVYLSRDPYFNPISEQDMTVRDLDVVVYVHLYNQNYLKNLSKGIQNFPNSKFLVSVPNLDMKLKVQTIFEKRKAKKIQVEIVPNRGRNFGPMLTLFSKEILNHEILVHIHSKAANGMAFRFFWSRILWRDLYLSKKKIKKNYLYFSDTNVGVLSTVSLAWTPPVFSWGGSFDKAQTLFPEITNLYTDSSEFLYPIGGMFWARVEAIRPILENLHGYGIFPKESENIVAIRNGKTSEHAIERFIGLVPEFLGFRQIVRIHERRITVTSEQLIKSLYN